jgi:hypothetical protein
MTALAIETTIPAFPLGQPLDGRARYGMTPEMAHVYNWLVGNKPHHGPFGINFRAMASRMARHKTGIHQSVKSLIERGWLEGTGETYSFVHPVMRFPRAP